ncbi:hypothetical protein TcCL_NonESM03248 [Trypanosoma cruzi]|nr:hypothetical protein TcCL_NonESM03248 [Trypanosoma cruzi]
MVRVPFPVIHSFLESQHPRLAAVDVILWIIFCFFFLNIPTRTTISSSNGKLLTPPKATAIHNGTHTVRPPTHSFLNGGRIRTVFCPPANLLHAIPPQLSAPLGEQILNRTTTGTIGRNSRNAAPQHAEGTHQQHTASHHHRHQSCHLRVAFSTN